MKSYTYRFGDRYRIHSRWVPSPHRLKRFAWFVFGLILLCLVAWYFSDSDPIPWRTVP
jgi:hypothetical protein